MKYLVLISSVLWVLKAAAGERIEYLTDAVELLDQCQLSVLPTRPNFSDRLTTAWIEGNRQWPQMPFGSLVSLGAVLAQGNLADLREYLMSQPTAEDVDRLIDAMNSAHAAHRVRSELLQRLDEEQKRARILRLWAEGQKSIAYWFLTALRSIEINTRSSPLSLKADLQTSFELLASSATQLYPLLFGPEGKAQSSKYRKSIGVAVASGGNLYSVVHTTVIEQRARFDRELPDRKTCIVPE